MATFPLSWAPRRRRTGSLGCRRGWQLMSSKRPGRAQQPVRERALRDGKLLYMAVPMLADDLPFYLLDPASLAAPLAEAASSEGAARTARKIGMDEMRPVDLVICGSVAVNRNGARLGKGAGYSDIEVALLREAGLIGPQTVIVYDCPPPASRRRSTSGDRARLQRRPGRHARRSDRVRTSAAPRRPLLGAPDRRQDRRHPLLTARAAASARERRMA
jgi:hypothetical protein